MDKFDKRKADVLSKLDKSFKGNWDERILDLCEKLNSSENYYTTSSCSGRVVLMIEQEKKERGLFLEVYHGLLDFEKFIEDIKKIKGDSLVKFKLEPCILHVACRDLASAELLLEKAKLAGWKKSGLISFKDRIILELNSTERFEFPVLQDGEILVEEKFMKVVLRETNEKMKRSWEKIERLLKSM